MATPENLHKNIPNDQLHSPKDFSTAGSGTALRKGWDGDLKWEVPYWQDSVLNRVDMALTPPTELDGDRYILINLTSTVVNADWDGASENDIVEYDLDASAWVSQTPFFDITVRSQADLTQYYFDGTTWNDASGGGITNIVEDTTPQLGGALDVQTFEITSTGANNIGLHSNASAYVELGDNLGSNSFDIRDNASGIKLQILSSGDTGIGKSTSLSTAWLSISTSNNNRAHINLEGSSVDKTTPVDGDLWYNTTAGTLNFYDGTTTTDLLAGGGGGLANVVDDTTPQLGGSLDVNGNKIVSVSNGDIDIEPNGTGNVLLGNMKFDADQTIGAGQDNYVLTYDNATGLISLEASAGGGSSEWADNGDGGISFDGTASGTKRYIEINDGTAFNPSGNITQGMIVVGDLHTSTNLIRRGMIFGYANQMATVGTATGEVIFGNTCITEGGQYNIVTGYLNTVKSGKNYSATFGSQNTTNGSDSLNAGNLNTINNDNQAIIGWSNKTQSGVPYQILFGLGMQATSNHGNRMIGFGMGSSRPNAGFVNGDTLTALNFAMGSDSALRTLDGAGLSGAGAGVQYWMRKNVTAPTVNVADAIAGYAQDRSAGYCGLVLKSEDGTNHFFGDFSVIGGDQTDANANKTLTVAGTGTGSGTSSLLCEDSAGASNLEVKDSGTVNMANLPTSSAGLVAGDLWNNSGVLNIV
jgi:hypothetical protein